MAEIAGLWPHVDPEDPEVPLAVHNALNNLLGYPHGREAAWGDYIAVDRDEVARILGKWRGQLPRDYFDGLT